MRFDVLTEELQLCDAIYSGLSIIRGNGGENWSG
jgi:hypothetical protein